MMITVLIYTNYTVYKNIIYIYHNYLYIYYIDLYSIYIYYIYILYIYSIPGGSLKKSFRFIKANIQNLAAARRTTGAIRNQSVCSLCNHRYNTFSVSPATAPLTRE